jgi:hypothetical protein
VSPKSKKRRFNPLSYPKKIRDQVEIDYAKKLTKKEQEWLAAFNEAEFGANPDCLSEITGQPITVEQRRKAWAKTKRTQRNNLFYHGWLEIGVIKLKSASSENALIEWIDNEFAAEMIGLELLKLSILKKYGGMT